MSRSKVILFYQSRRSAGKRTAEFRCSPMSSSKRVARFQVAGFVVSASRIPSTRYLSLVCTGLDDHWTSFFSSEFPIILIGHTKVEDCTKLRKKSDHKHMTVAELQAMQLGIKLATEYIKAQQITIKCDKSTAIYPFFKSPWNPLQN